MNIKLVILSLAILLTVPSIGQSLKVDEFKISEIKSDSIIRWECNLGPTRLSNENYPLIIINGKKFKNCLLQNIIFYFDTITISRVQVINPKNDSIKLYGKAGKGGVIIIKTKTKIEWISGKQILRQNAKKILSSHKKTLFKVDNIFFNANEELYFQRNLIENIYITNNTEQYYIDGQFTCVVTITITKKSSP